MLLIIRSQVSKMMGMKICGKSYFGFRQGLADYIVKREYHEEEMQVCLA